MEHTHKVNEDLSEENQELFNIRQEKAFNLFERDKKPNQNTLIPENGLFRNDTLDPFSVLLDKGNEINNPCTFSIPDEEIPALLEEIFKGNPWDNKLLSKPQASSTNKEISPLFIQELKKDWDMNPQTPHLHGRIHEPSNYEVKFSK
ncbi:hypothetical protein O181_065448 [Austropuccinia psidii MF-1]|uniref:Uncharacterized protein n=1 Tax=Austropuccinia psidii MF-1 TaxID=1389203 RepID=A0A9Q3EVD6_9BASI|nr:hypothetical protein [Austropuccinia psidii MF-1]